MPPAARLTISRADVADFLLEEIERPAHVGRIVGLAAVTAGATAVPSKGRRAGLDGEAGS